LISPECQRVISWILGVDTRGNCIRISYNLWTLKVSTLRLRQRRERTDARLSPERLPLASLTRHAVYPLIGSADRSMLELTSRIKRRTIAEITYPPLGGPGRTQRSAEPPRSARNAAKRTSPFVETFLAPSTSGKRQSVTPSSRASLKWLFAVSRRLAKPTGKRRSVTLHLHRLLGCTNCKCNALAAEGTFYVNNRAHVEDSARSCAHDYGKNNTRARVRKKGALPLFTFLPRTTGSVKRGAIIVL